MKNKIVGHEIHAIEPAPYTVEYTYHDKLDKKVATITTACAVGCLVVFMLLIIF